MQYGMSFENKPTQQMRENILNAAMAALEARRQGMPGISIAEYTYIAQALEAGQNIKQLSALLDFLQVKSEQKIQANKERDITLQAEQNQQLAQQQQQGEAANAQRKTQGELMVQEKKNEGELRKIAAERGMGNANTPTNSPQLPSDGLSPPS